MLQGGAWIKSRILGGAGDEMPVCYVCNRCTTVSMQKTMVCPFCGNMMVGVIAENNVIIPIEDTVITLAEGEISIE